MESWLSSAAPNRGRIITPGTHSIASLRLAARDSSMVDCPTTPTPPGVRSISSRARSGLMSRSSGTRSPSTRTAGMVGGVEGGIAWAHAELARARHITTVAIRVMRAPYLRTNCTGSRTHMPMGSLPRRPGSNFQRRTASIAARSRSGWPALRSSSMSVTRPSAPTKTRSSEVPSMPSLRAVDG
jgi:hypothetical protein